MNPPSPSPVTSPTPTQEAARSRRTFLHLSRPELGEAEIDELLDSIRSGWLTTGPKVDRLQRDLAGYLGVEHVRCLSSCTAGLMLALRVSGVEPGDEVLVPAMTFVSCANAVEHLGARPVFVDSDASTGQVDLDELESRIGPATKAALVVHLAGRPLDMDRLNAIRDRHGFAVIEDAAHAIGAEWAGARIGAFGNLTSFSFHATKNMTTFEGGGLVSQDEGTARRLDRLSQHGLSRSSWHRHGASGPDRYDVLEPGFKMAMHDISAAVGIHQLARLDQAIDRRAELARAYDEALADLPLAVPEPVPDGARHAQHVYAVRLSQDSQALRDDVIEGLLRRKIGSSVHFRPIHTYTYYAGRYGLHAEALPRAAAYGRRSLSLPLHPAMDEDDVRDVATALGELLR